MGVAMTAQNFVDSFADVPLEIQETLITHNIARLRLVAPERQGKLNYSDVEAVFSPACSYFLQELEKQDLSDVDQVVVSISDRELPFGATAPEAQQFFELYDVVNGECVWRGF